MMIVNPEDFDSRVACLIISITVFVVISILIPLSMEVYFFVNFDACYSDLTNSIQMIDSKACQRIVP